MYAKNMIAAGALLSVVAAVPFAKRDLVWVTETDEAVVTVPVTTTVWVNPGETVPTATVSHYGHHRHSSPAAAPSAPAYSAPAYSAPASSEAAPSSAAAPASSQAASSSQAAPSQPAPSSEAAPSSYEAPSTSSVYVAPTPSSTYVAPPPTTTSTSQWVAPSSSAAASSTQAGSYGSGSGTGSSPAAPTCTNSNTAQTLSGAAAVGASASGDLTWYQTGMGACGCNSGSSDHIVAISEKLFDQFMPSSGNPNLNPLCGKQISITGADGTAYTASIVDRCTGCAEADLDLSQDFFNTVTNNGDGRVHNMKWSFLN